MTKKSFKDNPAMQFISNAEEEPQKDAQEDSKTEETKPKAATPKAATIPPEGFKLNPLYVEVKSRRLQLVLQPSLYEKVKAKAAADGVSINEFVHRVLEAATQEEETVDE